jgi:two-component system, chemotaxis family, response regulator Rcp1
MSDAVIEILLVEDNLADVLMTKEALKASGIEARLEVVRTGEDAMRFLGHDEPFSQAPRPDVLVLDLNLPGKSGHEVLSEMASDPALNTIPVAILTTSAFETCVCEMYPRGRCLYFVKTDEFEQLQEIVRRIAAHASAA